MAGMMLGYYNIPRMMMPQMQQMPQLQQMSGMSAVMPGSMPQMQQMSGMMPQMQPGMMMSQIQQGSPVAAGGSRQGMSQLPGDNVYRPYMDLLSSDSPHHTPLETRTPLETQFPSIEMFSFEELRITLRTSLATQPAAPSARTRRSGKTKATSSHAETDGGAGDVEGWGRKRIVWSIQECVALAKAWISVVEDPYVSANQHIDRMWWRISQSYLKWKPAGGKSHDGEQCRKQWEWLMRQLSRFSSIYQKNIRSATSGMTSEDVKLLSHQQFPDSEKGFGDFKYWEVFLEVENSPSLWRVLKLAVRSGPRSTHPASTAAVPIATNSPKPRQRSRCLNRLPVVTRLGRDAMSQSYYVTDELSHNNKH